MEHLPLCPRCLSKFKDIRGMIFIGGIPMGQCEDNWHGKDPELFLLTEKDQEFLAAQHIGW